MKTSVHVFAGNFESRSAACLYSEEQWEPEPDDSVSNDEYAAWEERNPSWPLSDDLGVDLDPDFIETVRCEGDYDYLATMLQSKSDLEQIIESAPDDTNTLVLIFRDALHDPKAVRLTSTPRLIYCGEFGVSW